MMPRDIPVRVLFEYRGVVTKFLSFWMHRDNSIFIHTYRPEGTPWHTQPVPTPPSQPGEPLRIHFPSFLPAKFQFNKISFHRSGFIHLTDTSGQRYRDGIRGPAFETIQLPYDFAAFISGDPSRLPAFSRGKYWDLRVGLPDDMLPFHINLSLIDAVLPPPSGPGPIIPHPINFIFHGRPIGVAVTMWKVKGSPTYPTPDWPPFPFHLLRVAA
jgi:hypothetical protein